MIKKIYKQINKKYIIFLNQAFVSLYNFLSVILAARLLSILEFQIFSFYLIIIFLFLNIQNGFICAPYLSLNNLIIKDNKKIYRGLIFNLEIFLILFSILSFSILNNFISYFGLNDTNNNLYYYGCFYLFAKLYNDFSRKFYLANNKYLIVLVADIFIFVLTFFLIICVYFNYQINLKNYLLIFSISLLLGSWFPLNRTSFFLKNKLSKKIFTRHFNSSKWLTLNSFLTIFGSTFIQMYSGYKIGGEALSSIRICASIVRFFNLIILTMENYLPQKLSKIFSNKLKINIMKNFFGNYKLNILLLILFLSMFFFSEFLLGLIYGNKYKELSEVLQLYLIVPFLSLLITPLNILIRRYEKTKFLVISYLISLSITLFTINFFLENFFIKGAICALILSQLSYLTVIFIVINKFLKK